MADRKYQVDTVVLPRPPGEDSDDEDHEGLIQLTAEDEELGQYGDEAPPCCEQCAQDRLPISRLEERELRHSVGKVPRKCTDCLCVIIYGVFCLLWLAVAVAAILFGNVWSLTHGRDYQGRLCGYDEGVEGEPLVAYPRLNKDLMEFGLQLGYNIADVGNLDLSQFSIDQLLSMNVTGICVDDCPHIGEVICSYTYMQASGNQTASYEDVLKCNNGDPFSEEYLLGLFNLYSVEHSFLCSNCWIASLNSTEIFNRCLDIIYTTTDTEEECIFPVNTSMSADNPNCQTKVVVKTETSVQPAYDNPIAAFFGTVVQTVSGWVQSAAESWYVIVSLGIAGALVLGFAYVIFMRFCAGCVVWTSIVGIILVVFTFGAWCYIKAGWIPSSWVNFVASALAEMGIVTEFVINETTVINIDNTTRTILATLDINIDDYTAALEDAWKVFAVLTTVVVVILIVVVIAVAQKIRIGIALIEAASKVMLRLPGLVALPFATVVVIILFSGWMLFLLLMITSLEDFNVDTVLTYFTFEQYFDNCTEANTTGINITAAQEDSGELEGLVNDAACYAIDWVKQYGETPLEVCMIIYHLFMYLWTIQFIHAVMICIVAGAVCDWYWMRPSGPTKVKGGDGTWGDPVCKSCCRTFRFHLGSMLFGALLVAIVQIIRWIMAYIDKRTRSWQNKSKCLQCMFKIVHCCLCCFERCIKFITKNAYIMVAMEGAPFCDSCCHSIGLMLRNMVQFAVVSVFSQIIVMLGKIFIIAVVTGCGYTWLTLGFTAEVSSIVFPTVLTGLLAWFTSIAFLHVYDLAMASILLCFCEDLEVHSGDLQREALMGKKLQRLALHGVRHPHVLTKEEVEAEIEVEKHGKEMRPVVAAAAATGAGSSPAAPASPARSPQYVAEVADK